MDRLDTLFSALSDPTRRAILARLLQGEQSVGSLARPFAISAPAISRHLRVLEQARLIVNERRGKGRFCRLRGEQLRTAAEWLDGYEHYWRAGFMRLEALLRQPPRPHRRPRAHARGR